jgi:hypothetical protein
VGAVAGNVGVRNDGAGLLAAVQSLEYLLNISVGKRLLCSAKSAARRARSPRSGGAR